MFELPGKPGDGLNMPIHVYSLHTISLEMLTSRLSQSNQTSYIVAGFQEKGSKNSLSS